MHFCFKKATQCTDDLILKGVEATAPPTHPMLLSGAPNEDAPMTWYHKGCATTPSIPLCFLKGAPAGASTPSRFCRPASPRMAGLAAAVTQPSAPAPSKTMTKACHFHTSAHRCSLTRSTLCINHIMQYTDVCILPNRQTIHDHNSMRSTICYSMHDKLLVTYPGETLPHHILEALPNRMQTAAQGAWCMGTHDDCRQQAERKLNLLRERQHVVIPQYCKDAVPAHTQGIDILFLIGNALSPDLVMQSVHSISCGSG